MPAVYHEEIVAGNVRLLAQKHALSVFFHDRYRDLAVRIDQPALRRIDDSGLMAAFARSVQRSVRAVLLVAMFSLTVTASGCSVTREPGPGVQGANFDFEQGADDGRPTGWGGHPLATLGLDSEIRRTGRGAGRVQRNNESEGEFSSLTFKLPANVEGTEVTFSAWVRSRHVNSLFGLWMRQDRRAGETIDFVNNYAERLSGDHDWRKFSVTTQLQPNARDLLFGVMLHGAGTVWVDDVELTVDGRPYAESLNREIAPLPWELDTEFDKSSRFGAVAPDSDEIERLAKAIEVWGFVKYHHPAVAAGEVHIDFELFRLLPRAHSAHGGHELNELLASWIHDLGDVDACVDCAKLTEDLHLGPDIDWIRDHERLGGDLSRSLVQIYENRGVSGNHVFVGVNPGAGNPDFSGEPRYSTIREPDAGFRLLALARLWNIVRYWYPYRDLVDGPWGQILREYIPRLSVQLSRDEYVREMLHLVSRIKDTHVNIWNGLDHRPPNGDCVVDASFRFVGNEAVVWDVSDDINSVLRIGDVIRSIDGQDIDDLIVEWTPYYAACNEPTRLRDIARSLTAGSCDDVQIELGRISENGEENHSIVLPRKPKRSATANSAYTHDREGPTYQGLGADVAYLKLSTVSLDDIESAISSAQGKQGLVIDIRNYPSAFVVFELGQRLVAEAVDFARFTRIDRVNPGALTWTGPVSLSPVEPQFAGKVAILVDEASQSQSEYTAMAFRANPNAIVVGSTTAGADGNISRIPLPGGLNTVISGIGVFYPDKTPTQQVGIVPDVHVTPTVKGIRDGRDEVLEAALRALLGEGVEEELVRSLAARPGL